MIIVTYNTETYWLQQIITDDAGTKRNSSVELFHENVTYTLYVKNHFYQTINTTVIYSQYGICSC